MQKKFIYGLAAAAFAGSLFVACGDGDVSGTTSDDDTSAFLNDSAYYGSLKDLAVTACKDSPKCNANASEIVEPTSSSAADSPVTEPSSQSQAPTSSASIPTPLSSSSIPIVNLSSVAVSSSSAGVVTPTSSAAIVDDGTVNGTCAPVPATISKGGSTTWKFTILSPAGMAGMTKQQNAIFDWTMTGSTEGSFSAKGSAGGTAATATYAASGSFTATLTVDGNKITCSPLQVNGAPITGCECAATAPTVDVASGAASATWTVSGCTTDGKITGYTWTGATGTGETATATLSKKGDAIAPTVVVANDDNTQQEFKCAEVKAVDSSAPEYSVEKGGQFTLAAGTYTVYYACTQANQYYQPPFALSASGEWSERTLTYTNASGEEVTKSSNSHTISFADMFGSWSGALPTQGFTFTVDGAVTLGCQ